MICVSFYELTQFTTWSSAKIHASFLALELPICFEEKDKFDTNNDSEWTERNFFKLCKSYCRLSLALCFTHFKLSRLLSEVERTFNRWSVFASARSWKSTTNLFNVYSRTSAIGVNQIFINFKWRFVSRWRNRCRSQQSRHVDKS